MMITELIKNQIIDEAKITEFSYELKFWELSEDDLNTFLKINYDSFFKDYSYDLFAQQMKSFFELLSILAIENNSNVDPKFIIDNLYLIPYNTIKKFNKDILFFDHAIVKEQFSKSLAVKTLTKSK